MRRFLPLQFISLILAGFAIGVNSAAADSTSFLDDIVLHGFLSQGFTYTDENNYFGSSSNGSFKSNEFGLNASYRPLDQVNLSAQLLYKQMGNAEPKGINIDFAIVDWRLVDNFDYGFGLRIGRLKNPYGFFNETRDVAATRPSILLPESMYLDYLRALLHSSDSVGAYGHLELEKGTAAFSIVYGKPIFNDETVDLIVGGSSGSKDIGGKLEKERALISRISYEDGSGLWRAALTYNLFDTYFNASPADATIGLFEGDFETEQILFSLQFDFNDWELLGEYQIRNIDSININRVFNGTSLQKLHVRSDGIGYYYQLGYAFTPNFKSYIRRDVMYLNKDDKDGTTLSAGAALLGANVPAHSAFAKDITLGFIYEPSFEWSFGFELHRVNGTHWLPVIENPVVADQKQHWNMYLLQAAYRF